MADVVRTVRDIQVVSYQISADEVRKAVLAWLYDNHDGCFDPSTQLTLHDDGSATVATQYEKETV